MGGEIAFYRIGKPTGIRKRDINIDKTPLPESYDYLPEERADEVIKHIGEKVIIRYGQIDWNGFCLDRFGKAYSKAQYLFSGLSKNDYGFIFFDKNEEIMGRGYAVEARKDYLKEVVKPSILFRKELVSRSSGFYLDYEGGYLNKIKILNLAKRWIEKDGEYNYEYSNPLLAIMKAYFAPLRENEVLYAMVD